jgi:3-dehydroquinate dehydratase type I
MLKIGNLELGVVPRIAVPLTDLDVRHHAEEASKLADLFELRVDEFRNRDPNHAREVVRQARHHHRPLLCTVRAREEGGAGDLPDSERLTLYTAMASGVDAFDVEIAASIRDQVVSLAHDDRKPVIASFHDFVRTPSYDELTRLIDEAKEAGVDVVKITTEARDASDVDRLLGLLRAHRNKNLIVIAMGAYGTVSRVFFPLFGSLITYGFLNQPNASGQLSLVEIDRELRRYSPEYARAKG